MTRALDVVGELSLLSGSGIKISCKADGRIIEVGIESIRHGYSLATKLSNRRQRAQMLKHIQEALDMADLTIHFRVAKRTVALLKASSRPTLLSKLSGVAPVEIKPLALLLAVLKI